MAALDVGGAASEIADASDSEAVTLSLFMRKRQYYSSSEEASKGDATDFTEVARRAKTTKSMKLAAADEQPMQVAQTQMAQSRDIEDCVFVEFVSENISKVNTITVKKASIWSLGN